MNIKIYYDNINFRLKHSKRKIKLIRKVIKKENKIFDDLVFIFTSDKELIKINKEFLKHDYYTDVIAFNYSDEISRKGEVYISIDTVKHNANNYKVSLSDEILRVMIHGSLHLCGYDDKRKKSKKIMKDLEEKWIKEYRKK